MVHGSPVTAMVARSSSCVSEAKPVMDLITTFDLRRFVFELQLVEFRIGAAPRHQLLVRAAFDDAPALEDDDRVGRAPWTAGGR